MQDMRFGIIRSKTDTEVKEYHLDGKHCPVCHWPTETSDDITRRYCTSTKCSALIVE